MELVSNVQIILVEWHIIRYVHELLVSVLRYFHILQGIISLQMRIGFFFYQWMTMKQISASACFHFARGIDKRQITT
jgi:hypothetical protein